jgi:hypothetical protein
MHTAHPCYRLVQAPIVLLLIRTGLGLSNVHALRVSVTLFLKSKTIPSYNSNNHSPQLAQFFRYVSKLQVGEERFNAIGRGTRCKATSYLFRATFLRSARDRTRGYQYNVGTRRKFQ